MHSSELVSTSYSQAHLKLRFARKMRYHLLQIYLPSFLLVLVAGFSMFVPLTHIPGRYYIFIECEDKKSELQPICFLYRTPFKV